MTRLSEILGDDPAGIAAFLASVLPNMSQLCARIEGERDQALLRELAHELKGAAGNVGARELTTAAVSLESILKNGTADKTHVIEIAVGRILDACTRFSTVVRERG